MNIRKRNLHDSISQDLKQKMVFIGGPRQVGKTTLAQSIGEENFKHPEYLTWDSGDDRKHIMRKTFKTESDLIIFDELHKFKAWKNYLKGLYDKEKDRFSIVVTGSARLDVYRKGGDSLFGRYHYYRLHPFSLSELDNQKPHITPFKQLLCGETKRSHLESLLNFGGFPEPLFKQTKKALRRWALERVDRLIREDIRDIELVRDISSLQILVDLLMEKASGQLSLNSLREDLQVTHKTISLWVDILERFYYHFRIYPFYARAIQSLRKEPKLYLYDWSQIQNESAKFENLVASHLLKTTHYLRDTQGYKAELYYLRDTAGREVDFLVTNDKKPWFAVEVKMTDSKPTKHLHYFADRLKIPFLYQVVFQPNMDFIQDKIRVISAERFLTGLS